MLENSCVVSVCAGSMSGEDSGAGRAALRHRNARPHARFPRTRTSRRLGIRYAGSSKRKVQCTFSSNANAAPSGYTICRVIETQDPCAFSSNANAAPSGYTISRVIETQDPCVFSSNANAVPPGYTICRVIETQDPCAFSSNANAAPSGYTICRVIEKQGPMRVFIVSSAILPSKRPERIPGRAGLLWGRGPSVRPGA